MTNTKFLFIQGSVNQYQSSSGWPYFIQCSLLSWSLSEISVGNQRKNWPTERNLSSDGLSDSFWRIETSHPDLRIRKLIILIFFILFV